MESKDLEAIKTYLKFINRNNDNHLLEDKEALEKYASGLKLKTISLIRYYVESGIIACPRNAFVTFLQDKLKINRHKGDDISHKVAKRAKLLSNFHVNDDDKFIENLNKYEKELKHENEINLIKFLERLGYFDIYDDNNKFQEYIRTLTLEQARNFLITLNTKVNKLELKEKKSRTKDLRQIGSLNASTENILWYGASNETIEYILPILLSALKQIDNRKEQATLVYYTLVLLHMFEDGNGRTSRLIYDLIIGTTDLVNNSEWYFHNEKGNRLYDGYFEDRRNIKRTEKITQLLSTFNKSSLKYFFQDNDTLSGYKLVETIINGKIPMTYEIEAQLSNRERKLIYHMLSDNTHSTSYEIGGMIMLVIAHSKDELKDWINLNESNFKEKLVFNISDNPQMFNNWDIEDYRNIYRIGDYLKQYFFLHLIDSFKNPQEYLIGETPLKDLALKEGQKNIK